MKFLKILYTYWMKFALVVGTVNSKIIFTVLYVFMVGIYALILKSVSLVRRRTSPKSFWVEKKYTKPTLENMKRQF